MERCAVGGAQRVADTDVQFQLLLIAADKLPDSGTDPLFALNQRQADRILMLT